MTHGRSHGRTLTHRVRKKCRLSRAHRKWVKQKKQFEYANLSHMPLYSRSGNDRGGKDIFFKYFFI